VNSVDETSVTIDFFWPGDISPTLARLVARYLEDGDPL
jgi:hypothetical protein